MTGRTLIDQAWIESLIGTSKRRLRRRGQAFRWVVRSFTQANGIHLDDFKGKQATSSSRSQRVM